MPKSAAPRQAIRSILWGDRGVALIGMTVENIYMLLTHGRPGTKEALCLIDLPIPTYYMDVTPTLILNTQSDSPMELVFLCDNRPPEIIMLPYSWGQCKARLWEQSRGRLESTGDMEPLYNTDSFATLLGRLHKRASAAEIGGSYNPYVFDDALAIVDKIQDLQPSIMPALETTHPHHFDRCMHDSR